MYKHSINFISQFFTSLVKHACIAEQRSTKHITTPSTSISFLSPFKWNRVYICMINYNTCQLRWMLLGFIIVSQSSLMFFWNALPIRQQIVTPHSLPHPPTFPWPSTLWNKRLRAIRNTYNSVVSVQKMHLHWSSFKWSLQQQILTFHTPREKYVAERVAILIRSRNADFCYWTFRRWHQPGPPQNRYRPKWPWP